MVHFICVSFVYVPLCGAGQLEQVYSFLLLIKNNYIRPLASVANLRGNSSTPSCLVFHQITMDFEFVCMDPGHNIVQDSVVAPLPPSSIETNTTGI